MILMVGCEFQHTKPIPHIDYSKVEKVVIKANPKFITVENNDTVRVIPLKKVEHILKNINKSFNAGEIKYEYRTKLEIYFKDESVRVFELTGDIIRENSVITQNIKISNYSDSLWVLGVKK